MTVKWRTTDYRPARRLGSISAQIVERLERARAAKAREVALAAQLSAADGERGSDGEKTGEAITARARNAAITPAPAVNRVATPGGRKRF